MTIAKLGVEGLHAQVRRNLSTVIVASNSLEKKIRKMKPKNRTPKLRNRIAQRMLEDNYYRERKIISEKFKEPEKLTIQEATRIKEEEDE